MRRIDKRNVAPGMTIILNHTQVVRRKYQTMPDAFVEAMPYSFTVRKVVHTVTNTHGCVESVCYDGNDTYTLYHHFEGDLLIK